MNVAKLLTYWDKLSPLPGGRWLFSVLLGWLVPYTGSIGAGIQELRAGHCVAVLKASRRVSNHLKSIHAIALVNLGEVVSGLAINTALPHGYRGIVREINIEYMKKARGVLTASSSVTLPTLQDSNDISVHATIVDEADDTVAQVRVLWRISLVKPR